ncbi:SDR family oxidoreductase [Actinomadura harenae]|uniref:SDR family oxidoreductase n=1 Tax=Actinomadura harenae TaxID=2483351 RepID=A0A3M2MBI9_9ACTN|nr:SDR family oxidoreductase [Actinomadura harenae]RMI46836.1 SDR family oxidoreductase [Actinomadura harenae]
MGRFEGKVAIVTGAAGGIGAAYARALAAEGASVVVADVNDTGQDVADEIKGLFVHADVSDPASVQSLADTTAERLGGVDLLVNNAAIFGTMRLDFLFTVDWDYYKRFMAVNMDGALLCARAVIPHMQARGGGAIVNQSSTAAWQYSGFYGLAKVGVNGMTQQLAHELGSMNIRVNAIAPGPTDTEANRTVVPGNMVQKIVRDRLALKRMGTPEDLTGMCLFLLSDEARWITGQIINVDGGEVFRA